MIKNLLYVLAIAISTMSYGQTTTYTISHSGANHLVIAANGIFLIIINWFGYFIVLQT